MLYLVALNLKPKSPKLCGTLNPDVGTLACAVGSVLRRTTIFVHA